MAKNSKKIFVFFVPALLLAIESIIKYYFINKIPKEGFYFLGKFGQVVFVGNKNIAFVLASPRILNIILALLIIFFLTYLWQSAWRTKNILELLALNLILAGALSNLFDRIVFGYVIDYVNLNFWPVFNLSDALIIIGIGIYIIREFIDKNKTKKI